MGRSGQPGPAVSTGRAAEKAPTGTLGPRGKAIEPAQVSEVDKTAPVSQDDGEAAGAWIKGSFFKKGGVSDEDYPKIVAAMKGLDMLRHGEKWRDVVKERLEGGGPARATVVRVLKVAGMIKTAPELPEGAANVLAFLAANPTPGGFSLADLQARVGPKTTQEDIDACVDAGKVYEPVLGKWRGA